MELKEVRKAYRLNHKKINLCVECPTPTEEGKIRCEYHLEKQRIEAANRRANKRLRGESI